MVDSCKDDNCLQMFLRAMENSRNVNSAPILLQLIESTGDKKTSFAGYSMTISLVPLSKQFSRIIPTRGLYNKTLQIHFYGEMYRYEQFESFYSLTGVIQVLLKFCCH